MNKLLSNGLNCKTNSSEISPLWTVQITILACNIPKKSHKILSNSTSGWFYHYMRLLSIFFKGTYLCEKWLSAFVRFYPNSRIKCPNPYGGSSHLFESRPIWTIYLSRQFLLFSGFGYPDETLFLVFDILCETRHKPTVIWWAEKAMRVSHSSQPSCSRAIESEHRKKNLNNIESPKSATCFFTYSTTWYCTFVLLNCERYRVEWGKN